MTKTQIIYDGKRPAFAVVPYAQWVSLLSRAEPVMTDEELFDLAADDTGERLPHHVVKRLVNGEPPLKVYREWRGLTQEELAATAGVSTGYVSQIERGTRQPSGKARAAFASALNLDVDDLD